MRGGLASGKAGIRGLGIAESFERRSARSFLAAVVVRGDRVVDGMALGGATVWGTDATDSILEMCARLARPDVRYALISGPVMSMYNVADIRRIHGALGVPVVSVGRGAPRGAPLDRGAMAGRRFPGGAAGRIAAYRALGERRRVGLRTSGEVSVRAAGCTSGEARRLLDSVTLQGAAPEPIRLARLLARAAMLRGRAAGG